MPKSFLVSLPDVLAGEEGRRSIDADWQALLSRPDALPLPPEAPRVPRRFVPSVVMRILMRPSGGRAAAP